MQGSQVDAKIRDCKFEKKTDICMIANGSWAKYRWTLW